MAQPLVENLDGLEARFRDKFDHPVPAAEDRRALPDASSGRAPDPAQRDQCRWHRPAARGCRRPGDRFDDRCAGRPQLCPGLPLRTGADRAARPSAGQWRRAGAGRHRAPSAGAAAEAADHLPPGRPGVPAPPHRLHRGAGGRWLGGDQAVRGDGHGHFHRAGAVPERSRPRAAGGAVDEALVPRAQLRGDRAPRQGVVGAGAGVHRDDPAGVVQSARLRPERAFRAVGVFG
ncbi:hypothetical protein G6F22_016529 [Rhizopus arrhizus]|nr:hypothetical protein G6F22_016529 [Rhizopus arrhizus]